MGLFSRKKHEEPKPEFDRENEYPVVRCSICNGEQVAGFKDRRNGKFREYRMIRDAAQLKEFCQLCGVDEVPKEY